MTIQIGDKVKVIDQDVSGVVRHIEVEHGETFIWIDSEPYLEKRVIKEANRPTEYEKKSFTAPAAEELYEIDKDDRDKDYVGQYQENDEPEQVIEQEEPLMETPVINSPKERALMLLDQLKEVIEEAEFGTYETTEQQITEQSNEIE